MQATDSSFLKRLPFDKNIPEIPWLDFEEGKRNGTDRNGISGEKMLEEGEVKKEVDWRGFEKGGGRRSGKGKTE